MGRSGKHLFQASPRYPKGKGWSGNFDPITTLGASDWVNYGVFADVLVLAAPPAYALHDPLVPLPTADGLLTDWTSSPISPGAYAGICVRQMDQYSSASACFWVWGSISISRLHLNLSISISISLSQSQSQSRLVGVGLHLKAANPWALQMGSPDGLSRWALQMGSGTMARSAGTILAHGSLTSNFDLSTYHCLSLTCQGSVYVATIDGR